MPIEIRELHIRVAVNAAPGGQPAPGAAAEAGDASAEGRQKALVAECVEQVLRILQDKQER
ncbi:DUF5908 family protein [Cupriavidus necator]|uniref:DUF5908 family protein n=1 Tax=Cupriavidus necator TaxID=106590 RepID=UPI0039C4E526